MSDIELGTMARNNHGHVIKYEDSLNTIYKGYIDTIEHAMMVAAYDVAENNCQITHTFALDVTQADIETGIWNPHYLPLENAIINFCKKHKTELFIQRNYLEINIFINMLMPFDITYLDPPPVVPNW